MKQNEKASEPKPASSQPDSARESDPRSASERATEKAKSGEALRPDDRGARSPKQENL